MGDDRPVTGSKRLLRLAGMTAHVASGLAKSRIKSLFQSPDKAARERSELQQQSGALIAETLGELKGAVMKLGQMASLTPDFLPRELAEALSGLQRQAPPMPYEVIEQQIANELGRAPETLFRRFDRTAFAAASIGQVHRATTDDGTEVVVKVQYPGVDEAVDSDLSHFRLALRASGLLRMKRAVADAVFSEIRDRLHEELDYCTEADHVRLFGDLYAAQSTIVVPRVIGERSSQRILTLTYERGDSLAEAASYPQSVRDAIGTSMFATLCQQVFTHRTLHADPNPANFAFRPNGQIVLYDFGCVERLEPAVIAAYRDAINCGLTEDYAALEDALCRLGARNLDGPPVPPAYYKTWRDIFAAPFVEDSVFDFANASIHEQVLRETPRFMTHYIGAFQPPAQLVFLDRVIMGYYNILRSLHARVAMREILQPHLEANGSTEPSRQ